MENNIKYIDKDALVAEIERYKKEALERLTTSIERSIRRQIKDKAWVSLCQNLLSFIDTLEVKEVDLEKEIERLREHEIKWMDKQGFTDYHTGARDAYTKILESLYKDLKN